MESKRRAADSGDRLVQFDFLFDFRFASFYLPTLPDLIVFVYIFSVHQIK